MRHIRRSSIWRTWKPWALAYPKQGLGGFTPVELSHFLLYVCAKILLLLLDTILIFNPKFCTGRRWKLYVANFTFCFSFWSEWVEFGDAAQSSLPGLCPWTSLACPMPPPLENYCHTPLRTPFIMKSWERLCLLLVCFIALESWPPPLHFATIKITLKNLAIHVHWRGFFNTI